MQQNQEFSIQNEDFPALPGYKGCSSQICYYKLSVDLVGFPHFAICGADLFDCVYIFFETNCVTIYDLDLPISVVYLRQFVVINWPLLLCIC